MAVEKMDEVSVRALAKAFIKGSEIAYKAVMKPVEGTILTVIRESSANAYQRIRKNRDCTVEEYFDILCEEASISLDHTPELMPLLKEANVVDSGGYGLLIIFEAFKAALHNEKIVRMKTLDHFVEAQSQFETKDFGYCTEFILRLSETGAMIYDEDKLRRNLSRLGNSLVVVSDEDLVKVHVHTLTPGDVLNVGQRYGEFIKLKIENMQLQHEHIVNITENSDTEEKKPHSRYAIIAVAAGEGLKKTFRELRVDSVISGGQTMNPSCEDFVGEIRKLNADHIYILPNNSNIILAASQAKDICNELDITVFSTKTIQEGISACTAFNPEAENEDNLREMQQAIDHVVSGRITYAIKDTTVEGVSIHKNDYMGIKGSNIIAAHSDLFTTAKALIDAMLDDDAEIFTVIAGEDADEEITEAIQNYIEDNSSLEVEILDGNQPVFNYLFSIE